MDKTRISAVSFLNTLPFVYGIYNSGMLSDFELILDVPSECASKFNNNEVDIALVPVAALKNLSSYKLLNDFCIGSFGNVRTVLLLSQVPLKQISKIHLDYHSLTSINLVKILCQHYWHIEPEWVNLDESTEKNIASFESIVAIGDKTFELAEKYACIYDLSAEWKKFTGLPFVFACWIAHENVKDAKIKEITNALNWGVRNKREAIEKLFDKQRFPSVNIDEYLEKNIDFIFNDQKHIALNLFLNYINKKIK
jgi:chorismate dehydratase